MIKALLILWASPGSLLGLTAGVLGLMTGGGVQRVGRTLEFHGGFVDWLLKRWPVRAAAMTLGHVIIGRNVDCLESTRDHELVHVRQYERWGPLFIPAYVLCSLYMWLRGRNAYFDNPFEREAYAADARRRLEAESDQS